MRSINREFCEIRYRAFRIAGHTTLLFYVGRHAYAADPNIGLLGFKLNCMLALIMIVALIVRRTSTITFIFALYFALALSALDKTTSESDAIAWQSAFIFFLIARFHSWFFLRGPSRISYVSFLSSGYAPACCRRARAGISRWTRVADWFFLRDLSRIFHACFLSSGVASAFSHRASTSIDQWESVADEDDVAYVPYDVIYPFRHSHDHDDIYMRDDEFMWSGVYDSDRDYGIDFPDINPATGEIMVGGIDASGNLYGHDSHDDMFSNSSDDMFSNS